MAHYQQGQPTTRVVDEYGNPIPGGHGIQAQARGGYGATGTAGSYDAGGYGGQQAVYEAPTGTGTHDVGGHGGSGQPGFGFGTHGATGGGVTGMHGTGGHTHGVPGATGHGATGVTGTHGAAFPHGAEHKTGGGILRRSGSSTSSSSVRCLLSINFGAPALRRVHIYLICMLEF